MGTIIGDFFKKVGGGIGKVFDGEILDGLGDVLGGVGDAAGRTVNGALNLVGLGEDKLEPGTKLLLCEIALLAKMAKVDGRVDKSEIEFVNKVFDDLEIDGEPRKTLQTFFNEQKKNVSDAAVWAQDVLQAAIEMNPDDEDCGLDIRLQVYRHLFLMALSDGKLDDAEVALLRSLPDPLGFKPEVFDLVAAELSESAGNEDGDAALAAAYATLGVKPEASDAEVKKAWKMKMAAFHPDKIQSKDLGPEWMELANQKTAEINRAYEKIKAMRGAAEAPHETDSKPTVKLTQEALRLFAALAAVDGPPNAAERRFMETHFGPGACTHPSWNSARHSSVETLATKTAASYECDPKALETLSRLLHDFAFCDGFVSENETSSLSWIDYIFKSRSSKGPASTSGRSAGNATVFRCPECGSLFSCDDDSEEYLVNCPGCGTQLDLTELEPES